MLYRTISLAVTVLLLLADLTSAQTISPRPVTTVPNGQRMQKVIAHPQRAFVSYKDLQNISPYSVLQEADVPHPYLPRRLVRVQFYAPLGQPRIRQYHTKIVYDYGIARVEIKYRGRGLVVDYDRSYRAVYPFGGFNLWFFRPDYP